MSSGYSRTKRGSRQGTKEPLKIECPPTPERLAKLAGNHEEGGQGRMAAGSIKVKYRNSYELIADLLAGDYGGSIALLSTARYAYLLEFKANEGFRADTAADGNADSMPRVDVYIALAKCFAEQSVAVYAQTGRHTGYWSLLLRLIEPLPDNLDLRAARKRLEPALPKIATALDLLETYAEAIQRKWKKANAPSREDEDRAR